ncbi:MAG: Uma2 family endonuclease [Mogibacterium sp.]|nr:Uma2 family endonuclease [Mogibacterium sp.]
MTLDELRAKKRELGYTNEMIARISGVPLGTVQKIFGGATKAPRRETLLALKQALQPEREEGKYLDLLRSNPPGDGKAKETNLAYQTGYGSRKKQGTYTIEDYFALPEGVRAELIDGRFYDMASPSGVHQFLVDELLVEMKSYRQRTGHPCMPFSAPLGVQLDCDEHTVVEPDILVLCDRSKMKKHIVYGAPDLVVEVLSPSTRNKDLQLKFQKYVTAGVREYWIVDPEKQRVIVHQIGPEPLSALYSFRDRIPVGISGGDLVIDMGEITGRLEAYFGENWQEEL